MTNSSVERRKRTWTVSAITASLAAHVLVFGILASTPPSLTDNNVGQLAISVDLVRPERPEPRRWRGTLAAAGLARAKTLSPPPRPSAPYPRETETKAPYAVPILPMASGALWADERLGAALRGSLLGCVDADATRLTPSERQHCHDSYALRNKAGPALGADPKALALFDANARRANFLTQPFLSEAPKNGCRPIVTHKDYYVPNTGKEDMTVAMACGKSF